MSNSSYFYWNVSREIFSVGPLSIRWYGLFFAAGFLIGYQLMQGIYQKERKPVADLESLFVYMFLGTLVGARLGHCFFYQSDYYLSNPLELLKVWKGGLASHGAAIGIFLSLYLYSRRHPDQSYFWLISRIAICVPQGGALIRLGNFFNSEIIGTPSQVPWAVIFARVDNQPRHPAMLYESFAYLLTFFLLRWLYKKNGPQTRPGLLVGAFLICIFGARFAIEFYKEIQAPFEASLPLHMGQLLSIPLIILGLILLTKGQKRTTA